jgi:Predicted Fe-S oxidoreductases
MEILRAKTLDLRQTGPLSPEREANSRLNQAEALAGAERLDSRPRRLVLELTSACNLRCLMCGRSAQDFKPSTFDLDWLKIFEAAAPEIEEVTLMGWGEPTIHPRFAGFLRWAHERGLRKYFCTNGLRLRDLEDELFATETDIIAVSLDGASRETNEAIRRGSDWGHLIKSLEKITNRRARENRSGPWLNFVFTAMARNFRELPALVRLAAEIGLDEVKVVYFTAFEEALVPETLFGRRREVEEVFTLAEAMASELGPALKLPHLEGDDPAGSAAHKPCYTVWRDLFLGSDGRFRPCMSTSRQFFPVSPGSDLETIWNSPEYRGHRLTVNGEGMDENCRRCYQSSCANWNRRHAFIQTDGDFAPDWGK